MKTRSLISVLLLFSLMISVFTLNASAESREYAWYIKRNGEKQPKLSREQEIIKDFNAYYIDTSVCDKDEEKVLYLTYDAGYENGNIEKILDILKDEGIPAAFFILDNLILKNTDLVIRMADEGHLVCNHTKNHKNLSSSSKEEIQKNLGALETIYEEKTGKTMSKYFRFPEGKYSIESLKSVSELGYKTIFWSFAYEDWDNGKQMSCDKAMKKVLSNTHNGAIMLFHPTSETNAKILPELIKAWRTAGYRFGTLDDLS